jgi:hypothetical protein
MRHYESNYAANLPDNHPDDPNNRDWVGPVSPRENYLEAENDRLSVEVVELRAKVARQAELLRRCVHWLGSGECRDYPLEEEIGAVIPPITQEERVT